MFWVSCIIQDTEHSKPWLCACYDGCLTFKDAKLLVEKYRKNYRVLSAWIDWNKDKRKLTVFHECYVNVVGSLKEM